MRNKMDLLGGYFNGLNLNPIPLEFSQSMSTTKTIAALLAKLDQVIGFTNEWYDTILNDLEGEGVLYAKLTEQFGSDIATLIDSIKALEYKKPSISLTSSPATYLYSIGETINSVMLNYTVSKGSNNIIKAEIYKNDVLLDTITNVLNGINNYVDSSPITSDTSYYIKLYDDILNVSTTKIQYLFVYKAWYGKISNVGVVSESFIQTLNNIDFQNTFNFTIPILNDEKIIIVTHDILKSVFDSENYDLVDSFILSTINLNINNNLIPYNIYISSNPILDNNIILNVEKVGV